jgi:hypothetical protein
MTEMRNEERERANLRGGPEFMVFQQPTQRLVADNLPKSEVLDRLGRSFRLFRSGPPCSGLYVLWEAWRI